MKAPREDGSCAFAVIAVGALVKYRADFFSPAFFSGHAGNHNFDGGELLGNLYNAVKLVKYPERNHA